MTRTPVFYGKSEKSMGVDLIYFIEMTDYTFELQKRNLPNKN